MLWFVTTFLIPILFKILEPHFNLGLSFWLSSDKFLKYDIPFAFAATKKINKNSSIAEELNFIGHLIALNFLELSIIISAIFSPL